MLTEIIPLGEQDEVLSMEAIHGYKLSRDREGRSRGRKPEPLARSDRLFRSGMRLHPRDGMDSMTQSRFLTPPHPGLLHTMQTQSGCLGIFQTSFFPIRMCSFVEHGLFHTKHIAFGDPLMEHRQGEVSKTHFHREPDCQSMSWCEERLTNQLVHTSRKPGL